MTTVVSRDSEITAERLHAVKTRQQAMWASGDFAVIGTSLQLVGELLAVFDRPVCTRASVRRPPNDAPRPRA